MSRTRGVLKHTLHTAKQRPEMKAIVLQQPGRFERVEIGEPAAPGPGEALVRVHWVGICGSDVSGYLGKMPFFS